MAKLREEPQQQDYLKNAHFFYEILSELQTVDEVKRFLKEILTSSELRMIKKRWHIASLLSQGQDIRSIASSSKAGTNTVLKLKKMLEEGEGGIKLAINRMNEKVKEEKKEFDDKNAPHGGSKFIKGWFR